MVVDPENVRRRIRVGEVVPSHELQEAGISDQETQELQNRNRSRLDEIAGRRGGDRTNNEINMEQEGPGEARLNSLRGRLSNIAESQASSIGTPVNQTDRVTEAMSRAKEAGKVQVEAIGLTGDYPELNEKATVLANQAGQIAAEQWVSASWADNMNLADVRMDQKTAKNALPPAQA